MNQIKIESSSLKPISCTQYIEIMKGSIMLYMKYQNRLFFIETRNQGDSVKGSVANGADFSLVYRVNQGTELTITEDLESSNDETISSFFLLLLERIENERDLYKERESLSQRISEKAIKELSFIINSEEKFKSVDEEDHSLIGACKVLFSVLGIEYNPVDTESIKNSPEPLRDILHASKVQARKVILEGQWWKQDCGPLLVFDHDENAAALVPVKNSQYEIKQSGKPTIILTEEIAKSLKEYGYILYRSLPMRSLSIRDLFIFMKDSIPTQDSLRLLMVGLITGLLGLASPIVSGILFNTVIPESQKTQLFQVTFLLLSIGSVLLLFELTKAFTMLRVEGRLDASLQSAMWSRLITLPTAFFRRFSTGELVNRTMGINTIREMISGATFNTIFSALFSLFSLALLFVYSVRVAIIALILTFISVAVTFFAGWLQLKQESDLVEVTNHLSGFVLQVIGGLAKLRTSGNEDKAFLQWTDSYTKQSRIFITKQKIENFLNAFNTSYTVLCSMVIFYAALNIGNLNMGNFIAFFTAYINFQTGLMELSRVSITINAIIPTYQNLKPILEEVPEYDSHRIDPGVLDGNIELNHITFRYNPDYPPVIDDVSLSIKAGEYVAIVGGSGSGKSTIMRLLLGFENPENGRIYYSGKDLDTIDIRAVRSQLGVVLQNGKLLSGDIFTNIIGTSAILTIEDAWDAADKAGLKEDILLMPMKMHTFISEGSGSISGGQRQRMLIARAIVKKPKILFLDEATSALDNRTQAIVTRSLNQLNSTRIVIAHRLSTVMACDRIIVLERGKIVEQGTYDVLMENKGYFYELAKRQLV